MMKIIIAAVVSADGFIAGAHDPHPSTWSSDEDKAWFAKMLARYQFHVLGRKTFEVIRPRATPTALKLVLTHQPRLYRHLNVPKQLEFRNLTPAQVVANYHDRFNACFVLGGAEIYTAFLESQRVDEIFIVTEPVQLHEGVPMLERGQTLNDFGFYQISATPMNTKGTILHQYIK